MTAQEAINLLEEFKQNVHRMRLSQLDEKDAKIDRDKRFFRKQAKRYEDRVDEFLNIS